MHMQHLLLPTAIKTSRQLSHSVDHFAIVHAREMVALLVGVVGEGSLVLHRHKDLTLVLNGTKHCAQEQDQGSSKPEFGSHNISLSPL